jgi:hypothetical protein
VLRGRYYRRCQCSMRLGYRRCHRSICLHGGHPAYQFTHVSVNTVSWSTRGVFTISQVPASYVNQRKVPKPMYTLTSIQAPATPINKPVRMRTSHILVASAVGNSAPRQPGRARMRFLRRFSMASSASQSMVSPSSYLVASDMPDARVYLAPGEDGLSSSESRRRPSGVSSYASADAY